jgi:FkbM family methyltransferase
MNINIEEYAYANFLKSGDVVYDIGAHIGERSINFANSGAKDVYAFEPVSFNFDRLVANTSNYPNIHTFNIALHEREYECVTKFRHCDIRRPEDQETKIKYCILPKFIIQKGLKLPDFLKFDIEGMESFVLKTCNFLFSEQRSIFFVEIHAAPKNERQSYENCPHWATPEDGGFDFNILKKLDYKIMDKTLTFFDESIDWNPVPVQHKGIIMIPSEKL